MTPESFEALLRFLDPERDVAAAKYEAILRRLVRLAEWRGFGNPEELADRTMDRVAQRILEGVEVRSDHPYGYFCGVAQNVFREELRRLARERTAMEREIWPSVLPVDEPEDDDRLACLRRCLARLPDEQRFLVLRYHQEDDHIRSRQMLSRELGIPMNALRIRVHRIRRNLENCVQERLRKSSGRDRQ